MNNNINKANIDTYANIVKKKNNIADNDNKNVQTNQTISRCVYDEVCSREKMCGDCAADEFESQRNEEAWENFRLDRKIELSKMSHFY
jgi:hypothetical protein